MAPQPKSEDVIDGFPIISYDTLADLEVRYHICIMLNPKQVKTRKDVFSTYKTFIRCLRHPWRSKYVFDPHVMSWLLRHPCHYLWYIHGMFLNVHNVHNTSLRHSKDVLCLVKDTVEGVESSFVAHKSGLSKFWRL